MYRDSSFICYRDFIVLEIVPYGYYTNNIYAVAYLVHGEVRTQPTSCPETKFLDEIQTKILRVFLLAINCHLYSFALSFFKLTQPLIVSTVLIVLQSKTFPGFKKSIQKPQVCSLNSQDYVQKPQRNCMFMNSASE